jgi:AAA ATPase domain
MVHSPYRPGAGSMPAFLAGRAEEISRVEQILSRTEHYGTPAAAPFILTGPRGVGKTVTLQAVRERAAQRGFVTAHLTLDRHGPFAPRLAAALAEPLAAAQGRSATPAWKRWNERLRSFSVEVSVAGVVKVGGSLERADASPVDRDALRELLTEGADLARSRGRRGLFLSFDEIQEAVVADLVVLTNLLQDVLGAGSAPIVVVGAGLPATPERLMSAGSFAERFTYRTLDNLTRPEATEALLRPATEIGVRWEEEAADLVLDAAQGAPFLVQLYGDTSWQEADPRPRGAIRAEHARAGLEAGREALHHGMFRGRWNRATAAEKRLLAAVAACADDQGVARTADVVAHLGRRSATAISAQRARLLDKGLLHAPARGQLSFALPGFADYVRGLQDPGA